MKKAYYAACLTLLRDNKLGLEKIQFNINGEPYSIPANHNWLLQVLQLQTKPYSDHPVTRWFQHYFGLSRNDTSAVDELDKHLCEKSGLSANDNATNPAPETLTQY